MTIPFTTWAMFSQLALSTLSTDSQIANERLSEKCREAADLAILGAVRLVGQPDYFKQRDLLRALDCNGSPTVKRLICRRLAQRASQIGSQGTPGHKRIRELIADMECHRNEGNGIIKRP